MKILIISGEVWMDGTNGGNVLSNIFSGFNAEFAQIYCNPGTPKNSICRNYYQMTDRMIINNVFKKEPIGNHFVINDSFGSKEEPVVEQPNKGFYSFFHRHRLSVFYCIRHILWNISNWKNDNLSEFVKTFNPDIVFAPCYGNTFMLKLTRHVHGIINKPIISYISDDSYSLKQISFSPFYWLSRFSVRGQLRKTFPYYSLVYTMTDTQKEQCEKVFNANTKILLKSVDVSNLRTKQNRFYPIKMIYAGGVYLNRWKTLNKLMKEIESINNKNNQKLFELNIYTSCSEKKIIKKLTSNSSIVHKLVSSEELNIVYNESDIALHVESFKLKNRLAVRMSFSTKITDCLGSGCAVMAICDKKQGGLQYLEKNDAAICITKLKDIGNELEKISKDLSIIDIYTNKAKECCIRNHDSIVIKKQLYEDFVSIAGVK